MLQNSLQPKNSQRTDAIKENKYIEIETLEQAQAFIANLITINLGNELKGAESTVLNALASMATLADLKKLVEAPDVFVTAVALSEKSFYEGRGDRTSFFKCIQDLNPARIPDLGRKLKLVTDKEFMGLKLYNDKLCEPERVNKKTIFNLWLHCCRKSSAVTVE